MSTRLFEVIVTHRLYLAAEDLDAARIEASRAADRSVLDGNMYDDIEVREVATLEDVDSEILDCVAYGANRRQRTCREILEGFEP